METIKPRPSRTQIVVGMAQSATGAPFTISDIDGLHAQLVSRAPSWALCGDTPQQAGREESRRPAEHALAQRFCQLNPRGRLGTLIIDLDHQHGPETMDAPPATYATTNPDSGHCQAGYVLLLPVSRGKNSRQDIQQLAADVHRALTRELSGDPAFTGLISRGPFHPDHRTRLVGGRLWTLAELLRDLPPMPSLTRREARRAADTADIEGRNCAAFEALRLVAYRLRNQGATGTVLLRQVQERAEALNRDTFEQHAAGMLSARELAGVVRSVCRWTDTHHRPGSKGSPRARIHSRDREPLSEAQQQARRQEGLEQTAATKREATRAKLRAAVVTLTAQGQPVNAETLSLVAGVSKRTVFNHSDIWN